MIGRFLRDESGAVTVDYTVFLGGVIWMGMTIVGDVATATMFVTDKVNTRMSYARIVEEIHGSFGPDSVAGGGGDEDGAADNPGESAAGGGAF